MKALNHGGLRPYKEPFEDQCKGPIIGTGDLMSDGLWGGGAAVLPAGASWHLKMR